MHARLIDLALDAKDNRTLITPPSHHDNTFGLDEGYQVYAGLDKRFRERGYQVVGRKIGFTNQALWEEFDIHTPIWAYIYDQTCQIADTGQATVNLDQMLTPRLEPELVLKVNDRIQEVDNHPEALIEAIDWVAIGFELVECHYANWEFSVADALADGVLHCKLIVGPQLKLDVASKQQVREQLESCSVQLYRDSELIASGFGRNALGSPLKALAYLRRVLDSQSWAEPLQGGELITTGSLTSVPFIQPGEAWSVEVSGLDVQPLLMVTE